MQAIIKNIRYTEAQNTLSALSAAFNAATAEESRLLALLAEPADKADPLQAGLRLLRDVGRRLEVERLRTAGAVNTRLLVSIDGLGSVGDVVRTDGATLAHLVALGHGEQTQAKPAKAPRPLAATADAVLS